VTAISLQTLLQEERRTKPTKILLCPQSMLSTKLCCKIRRSLGVYNYKRSEARHRPSNIIQGHSDFWAIIPSALPKWCQLQGISLYNDMISCSFWEEPCTVPSCNASTSAKRADPTEPKLLGEADRNPPSLPRSTAPVAPVQFSCKKATSMLIFRVPSSGGFQHTGELVCISQFCKASR
jgi:hypothetical protein